MLKTQISSTQSSQANVLLLRAIADLLEQLSHEQYCWRYARGRSSIGGHARHIIEHYDCFFQGVPRTRLCYDHRPRDPDIEQQPAVALTNITRVLHAFDRIELSPSKGTLVSIMTDPSLPPKRVESCLGRELLFLQSHTLHHMAMMQVLAELQGVTLADNFAAAPATQQFQELRAMS